MIEFYKYQGAGNDFIMIDNRVGNIKTAEKLKLVNLLCKRRFGIGSDGLIFIENNKGNDFYMDFFNPDGSQSFCGNGSRCAVAFSKQLGIIDSKTVFGAIDGIHYAEIKNDKVKVSMQNVHEVKKMDKDYFIDTGSPHFISYCSEKEQNNILEYGKEIRYSDPYKKNGVNVNMVNETAVNAISIRTYERGVEAETFACGTGATAAALSYADKHGLKNGMIAVKVKGGDLKVYFEVTDQVYQNIWLEGPAEVVFIGNVNID